MSLWFSCVSRKSKDLIFLNWCVCICTHEFVCSAWVQVPLRAKVGHQIPINWNYRQLWVLEQNLGSLQEQQELNCSPQAHISSLWYKNKTWTWNPSDSLWDPIWNRSCAVSHSDWHVCSSSLCHTQTLAKSMAVSFQMRGEIVSYKPEIGSDKGKKSLSKQLLTTPNSPEPSSSWLLWQNTLPCWGPLALLDKYQHSRKDHAVAGHLCPRSEVSALWITLSTLVVQRRLPKNPGHVRYDP